MGRAKSGEWAFGSCRLGRVGRERAELGRETRLCLVMGGGFGALGGLAGMGSSRKWAMRLMVLLRCRKMVKGKIHSE